MIVLSSRAPPERRWLAHLLRAAAGAIRAGDRFDDDLPFDGSRVLALALRHQLAPLLHKGFATGRIADPLPDAFPQACRRLYDTTRRQNAVVLEIGSAVLGEFARAGVAAAPLLGYDLLTGPGAIYEDPGTRPLDAVELMVGQANLGAASEVLGALGFGPLRGRSAAQRRWRRALGFQRRLGPAQLLVVLHSVWTGGESVPRAFGVPGERFIQDLCQRRPDGLCLPLPLGQLLVVAVHGARQAFRRWIWLLDIHRLLEAASPDWEAIAQAAHALRVRNPLYVSLAATRELLRSPVPKEVLAALAPGPLRRQLLHRTLAASAAAPSLRRRGRVASLLLGESWWDVVRTAAWAATPLRPRHEDRRAARPPAVRPRSPAGASRFSERDATRAGAFEPAGRPGSPP